MVLEMAKLVQLLREGNVVGFCRVADVILKVRWYITDFDLIFFAFGNSPCLLYYSIGYRSSLLEFKMCMNTASY